MYKIAVVDDTTDNRQIIRYSLEPDFEVVEFEDGRTFLDAAGSDHFSLVILDLSMPDLTGYEVLTELHRREHYRRVPIIALTARAMAADKTHAMTAGFTDYITKPFNPDDLLAHIKKYFK